MKKAKTIRTEWHNFLGHTVETSVFEVKGVGPFRFYRCSCGLRWGRNQ